MKTPHDVKEKERRKRKAPHADAKTTEQRSFPGMKMTESQFAPHWRMGGVRSTGEPHGVGVTHQKYALLDPGGEAP